MEISKNKEGGLNKGAGVLPPPPPPFSLHTQILIPLIFSSLLQRKKFEIRAVGCPESRKFTYYTSSDDKSKHLLYLCRVTHQFSMAMQPKLAELRKLEEEGNSINQKPNDARDHFWICLIFE